jgi:60 kDa SS-A/Ro ribonucleoprotein
MNNEINNTDADQGIQTSETPQCFPLPGREMVTNSAGGYSFTLDPWKRLDRFLILGTEGGTYYASESKLNEENTGNIIKLLSLDGSRFVRVVMDTLFTGRAPKPYPAIYALALAASKGDDATRKAALKAVPDVLKTGTHLLTFVREVNQMRGWGRGLKGAVQRWLKKRPNDTLALQVLKYKQREGWSMRDVLRLAKPAPANETQRRIFEWVADPAKASWSRGEIVPAKKGLGLIWASTKAHHLQSRGAPAKELINLITHYKLPREALPSQALSRADVWEALLQDMPMTAMIRNLGTMSKVGLLKAHSAAERTVVDRLRDAERLKKARVHPIQVLSALNTYASGHGALSVASWEVCEGVVKALDESFELAFGSIEPAGTRHLLCLDVSGSMSTGEIAGIPGLTPAAASAALAMIAARTEPWAGIMGFADTLSELSISPKDTVHEAMRKTSDLSFGGTDCALPMIHAMENKLEVDTFVVLTDNETWAGAIHPSQALVKYRDKTGIDAKLIVVGMTATEFTIADPKDPGMLDFVGFDAAAPALMSRFAKGQV